jgi:hypothetical protein
MVQVVVASIKPWIQTPVLPKIKTKNIFAGEDVEKKRFLHILGGNVNYYNHYGKQYGVSTKN